jgi:hypothetical protein
MSEVRKIEKMSERECKVALKEARDVVTDVMKSHEELLEGVGGIVPDYALLNMCRVNGSSFLRKYQ